MEIVLKIDYVYMSLDLHYKNLSPLAAGALDV